MEIGSEGELIPNNPDGYLHVFWSTIDELEVPIAQKRRWEAVSFRRIAATPCLDRVVAR